MTDGAGAARERIDAIYRADSRRVLATLIRLLGDFDLAEEALQDAFSAAVEKWQANGVPSNPRAWLVSAGRFSAIDRLRRHARFDASRGKLADQIVTTTTPDELDDEQVEDDQLRLVFTCCHPALTPDAQIALTLREICGLTTEEIAHAFLTTAPTVAQRIVRAKNKIREAHIPYEVPTRADLPERLDTVLHVLYLVFNEGYSAHVGDAVTRLDLCSEAIRLGRLLAELIPEAETMGLLALMLLHDARRSARTSLTGDLILLDAQDRSLWNQTQIMEGVALVESALAVHPPGPYALQAAIAAVHAESPSSESTDWTQIVGLYNALLHVNPSPVVELNRAVAVAMRDGPQSGLDLIDQILERGELDEYQPARVARAELLRKSGQHREAVTEYRRAIDLTAQGPERRSLERRLAGVETCARL